MATSENKQPAFGQQGDQKQDGSDDMDQWIEDMNSGTTEIQLQKNIGKHLRMNPRLRDTLTNRLERIYDKKKVDTPQNRRGLRRMLWRMIYKPMFMGKYDFWDTCSKSYQSGVATSKNSNPIKIPYDGLIDDIIQNAGT